MLATVFSLIPLEKIGHHTILLSLFPYMSQHSLTPTWRIWPTPYVKETHFASYDIYYAEHSNRTDNTARGTRLGGSDRVVSTK